MLGRLPPCALRARLGAWFGAPGARSCVSDGDRLGSAPHGPRREWTLPVSPFGRLRARLPCHLLVRPLDPHAHPDGDRVQVAVCGVGREAGGLDGLQVEYDAARQEMAILSDDIDPRALVEVNAPVKFDLNIESSGSGSVKVQNVECDRCEINTAQGASILQAVKCVTLDKLQGSCVNISTEDGLLKVKYLYTESSFLSSAAGDIALGNVHGNIVLQSKMGNITVDSSSGCLKASSHQGAIDVYISQLEEVALTSQEGSITVKAPSSLQAYLKLSGKEVVVDADVHVHDMTKDHKGGSVTVTGLMNQARSQERWINAVAPKGTVSFKHQSWFQSLKLPD
ncbi:protein FAM185A isoform X2 [Arvicola amphibius]|uniref:protein FAM185A isoform X2 n=1 Tax=Arvicola amphibius TaxID=1047088 RepID=UPI0018E2DE68|nr:protein FAM185A isoform X2 [Arvicola amphibius]